MRKFLIILLILISILTFAGSAVADLNDPTPTAPTTSL